MAISMLEPLKASCGDPRVTLMQICPSSPSMCCTVCAGTCMHTCIAQLLSMHCTAPVTSPSMYPAWSAK